MLGHMANLDELPVSEQITFLRRYVLISSILYYEFSCELHDDKTYDSRAYLLAKLQDDNKELSKSLPLYYAFDDFDASTGFHLMYRLTEEDKGYFMNYARLCRNAIQNRLKNGFSSIKAKP